MKLIQTLSESQLLSSTSVYRRYTACQLAEMVYLHVISLRILMNEPLSKKWAMHYSLNTGKFLGFSKWYQNATDLHLLIHGLVSEAVTLKLPDSSQKFKETLYFDEVNLLRWLKDLAVDHVNEPRTHALFMKLDAELNIKDSSMKAVRRLVQDWPTNSVREKELTMTRLLQIMRVKCRMSDMMSMLENTAKELKLEIFNVDNPDTGHKAIPVSHKTNSKQASPMLGYSTIRHLGEDDGGATTSADIASVVQPLGLVQRRVRKRRKSPAK